MAANNVSPVNERNPDPITNAPGSHPLGVGVGAAVGGGVAAAAGVGAAAVAGASMGAVAGPIGAAIGAVAGAVVGGLVGKNVAEHVNPTVEHDYWKNNYTTRPYANPGTTYDDYGPAYQLGWESYGRYSGQQFEEVEPELSKEWETNKGQSSLKWEHAREAARDSWDRVGSPVSTLNDLIETLKDGQNGFEAAAADVKDASVKSVFQEFSRQRSRLAGELQAEVSRLGGEPEHKGSASAAAHRGWMDLKKSLGAGEKSILNEAERGEDVAVQKYEKAMRGNLPANIAGVVSRQYLEVKRAHDRVKNLRDTWKS